MKRDSASVLYVHYMEMMVDYMITLDEYLKSPCAVLSIPYWKYKTISVPDDMKIIHDRDASKACLGAYIDEPYFRLSHNMREIGIRNLPAYDIVTAQAADFDSIVSIINGSYVDISVSYGQIKNLTRTPVYNSDLWIIAIEKTTGKQVGCGIADYDPEAQELILEWVQVLPGYRGQKVGQTLVNELLYRMKETAKFATVSGKVENESHPEALYRKCGFTGSDIWHILRKREQKGTLQ